jgi:hypothetical protein
LAIEYFPGHFFVFYYGDRCVQRFGGDGRTIERVYPPAAGRIRASRVLIDLRTVQKVLITDRDEMYTLVFQP